MIGCFGKVPASADFISLHGAVEEVREFDQWLQSGLMAPDRSGDWRDAFDRLPVCFFCYRARSGNWLLGGLIISQDASARRYPFMIFQLLNATAVAPLVNPFTLSELFCSQIKPLLHLAVQSEAVPSLFERIAALRPLQAQDVALFQRVHQKFMANYSLADISKALLPAYPEYVQNAALTRLQVLARQWHGNSETVVSLPLPAERGLKNPVADLWITWLATSGERNLPAVSVLADDFLRPRLLCMTSRSATGAYRVLTSTAAAQEHYDLLASFARFDEQHRPTTWPDDRLPLHEFIDRFVETLEVTRV
jgi:type VI secretion system protein ImpM